MSGSISSEIPYEVEYSLRSALKDWINRDAVITTAIVNERDFHFYSLDPWQKIKILIPKYNFSDLQFDALLIQVALPRLYKHRPLYNVALYHELGHFIDTTIKLTEVSLLIGPLQGKSVNVQMHRMHRMEHFADLFAANYVGKANSYLLKEIAGRNSASFSHPSTADRIAVVEYFMSGKKNSIIDLFQQSLSFLKAPSLKIRYNKPDISNSFNNIRP